MVKSYSLCRIIKTKKIASSAKSCPECGAKNKNPIYKRPWFVVIAFFVIGRAGNGDSTTTDSATTGTGQKISQKQNTESYAPVEEKVEADVPTEYKSALRKAKTYSDTMNMSKVGLHDQLTSEYGEKFTAEAAQYAIDNLE